MRTEMTAGLVALVSIALTAVSAAALPVAPATVQPDIAAIAQPLLERVHGRIPYGNSYRYASPYYSYGYPRLYYYPWGLDPRRSWHRRRHR